MRKHNVIFKMKNFIANIIRQSLVGKLLINWRRIFRQRSFLKKYNDEDAIKKLYQARAGRILNLDNPVRFTEKLQWYKLHYRNPLMTRCADKIAIRDYLTEKGYGEYLVPVIGCYRSVEEIDFHNLPERCIFKAAHGSSMHLVKNGKIPHPWLWRKIMSSWLKMNIYAEGREWPYRDVPPGIICEKFMAPNAGEELRDFKFFCFHGKPYFVQVDSDLLTKHRIDFFDIEWKHLYLKCQYPNSATDIPCPRNYDTMIKIASDLSSSFPHVRVDFYEFGSTLKIGELTFFDGSDFYSFHPDKYDFIFGEHWLIKNNTTEVPTRGYSEIILLSFRPPAVALRKEAA